MICSDVTDNIFLKGLEMKQKTIVGGFCLSLLFTMISKEEWQKRFTFLQTT